MKTPSDVWCARNLGILSILGVIGPIVCGPVLLPLLFVGLWYVLNSIGYIPFFQAASWFTACLISVALLLYGIFLLVQYFRYPKLGFGLSKRVFWVSSVLFCPAWTIPVALLLEWPLRLPSKEYWDDFMPLIGLGLTLMILPLCHCILSVIALISINKAAEQGSGVNVLQRVIHE